MKKSAAINVLLASILYKSNALGENVPNTVQIKESKAAELIPLDQSLFAFSIEQGFFIDFAGTVDKPNVFSQKLINNIQEINGVHPPIRVGGNTQDHTKYDPTAPVMVHDSFSNKTSTPEPNNARIGPGFYEAFKNLNGTYTLGLNFASGDYQVALNELKAGYAALHDRLELVELGNEPDLYNSSIRNPWNTKIYAQQHSDFTQRLIHDNPMKDILLLGGIGHGPKITTNKKKDNKWNAVQLIKDGIDTSHAKSWSSHFYAQSACTPNNIAQLSYSELASHSVIETNWAQYKSEIAAAKSKNLTFIIGEGNTAVCHGADGLSNTMVSTIWALDHVFYGATLGVQRFHLHNGRDFFYNVFQPNGTGQGVRPLYYAYILSAWAIGPNTTISPISTEASTDNLVIYGLYEDTKLQKMIVINSQVFNTTTPGTRPSMTVQFKGHSGTLHRLTGPGADAKTGITFAGRSYSDTTGEVTGTIAVENWSDSFSLNATEAALVYVSK